jgi:hypothetical protein
MTRRYIIRIGELGPMEVLAKHPRAVVNRYVTEPDTVAIVRESMSDTGRMMLWRANRTGLTERIGWIMEADE